MSYLADLQARNKGHNRLPHTYFLINKKLCTYIHIQYMCVSVHTTFPHFSIKKKNDRLVNKLITHGIVTKSQKGVSCSRSHDVLRDFQRARLAKCLISGAFMRSLTRNDVWKETKTTHVLKVSTRISAENSLMPFDAANVCCPQMRRSSHS